MQIDFTPDRWDTVKENYRRWWAGELDRPLIHMQIGGRDPGRPEPKLPMHYFTAFYDFDVPAEDIVDRWDWELSRITYLGDAFPSIWPNFGAGVLAAILGARATKTPETDTVWFAPPDTRNGLPEIADVRFQWDPDNIWLQRIADVKRAAMDRWEGSVQVGMTGTGGNLDILSTFRPSEKLLFDLIDHPDEVKRLTWDVHELGWRAFDQFDSILQPQNPGYTTWVPIFSQTPYEMLQCDFSYMIGPDMFEEFVKPELVASCRRLDNPFYHLDGPGQLPHLDSLLAIPELKGIQWVPGTGNTEFSEWPEIYRRIRDAGKLAQVWTGPVTSGRWEFDTLVERLDGDPRGLIAFGGGGLDDEADIMKLLHRYEVTR